MIGLGRTLRGRARTSYPSSALERDPHRRAEDPTLQVDGRGYRVLGDVVEQDPLLSLFISLVREFRVA